MGSTSNKFCEKCHEVDVLNARERTNIVNKIIGREERPIDVLSVYFKELINSTFTAEIENILRLQTKK